jgi:transcriptional regulator with XRE-family HTH domain
MRVAHIFNEIRMMAVPAEVSEARSRFGAGLRELRKQASLTGRDLAARTGLHFTKVSRVEHGRQNLTDAEIRAWCAACGAADRATSVIGLARRVEALRREWQRQTHSDRHASLEQWYDKVRLLRIYERATIPVLLQTPIYAKGLRRQWMHLTGTPTAVAPAPPTPQLLHSGLRRFTLILEEQALRTRVGNCRVMVEQLEYLLGLLDLPRVSVGIIPAMAERTFIARIPFWIWDDARVTIGTAATVDAVTRELDLTRQEEVALYIAAFDAVNQSAVYGDRARELINTVTADFRHEAAQMNIRHKTFAATASHAETGSLPVRGGRR